MSREGMWSRVHTRFSAEARPQSPQVPESFVVDLVSYLKVRGENKVRVAFLKHKRTRIAPHSLKCILGSFIYA